jgi:hypothetical protein
MTDFAHRLACVLLLAVGIATIAATGPFPADAALAIQHRDALLLLLGIVLCVAAMVPSLRLPSIAAGLLAKGAWLAVALFAAHATPAPQLMAEFAALVVLSATYVIFLRESRLESRWDSALPSRQEI